MQIRIPRMSAIQHRPQMHGRVFKPIFFLIPFPVADAMGLNTSYSSTQTAAIFYRKNFSEKKNQPYLRFGRMDKTDSLLVLYMPMGRKVNLRVTDTGMHMQDIKETVEPGKKDYTLNPVPNGSIDFSMPYSMDGAYFYQASGATFTPCGQDVTYPVKPAKASFEAEKLFLGEMQKKSGPIYLRALVRISKEKDLAGMDQQMVWMEDLINMLREAECNSSQ